MITTTEDLPGEIWKPLKVWKHHKYLISNMGRIKSAKITKSQRTQNHIIKTPHVQRYGSGIVNLTNDKTKRCHTHYIAPLMAEWLGPKPTPKHMVYHTNNNKLDNRLTNLRWATQSEINIDGIAKGYRQRPKRTPHLTYKQYALIEKYHKMGYSQVKIGKIVGCTNSAVSKFLKRNCL